MQYLFCDLTLISLQTPSLRSLLSGSLWPRAEDVLLAIATDYRLLCGRCLEHAVMAPVVPRQGPGPIPSQGAFVLSLSDL